MGVISAAPVYTLLHMLKNYHY